MLSSPLPAETPKSFWSNGDCFDDHPHHFINAFLHKNYRIGMHSHEFVEMNIVVNGSGLHFIEHMSMPVKAGDIFVIPSGILHGYLSQGDLDVFHILIKSDFFKRYVQDLECVPGFRMLFDIAPYLRQSTGERFFLHLECDILFSLRQELEQIQALQQEETFSAENIAALNLIASLSLMMDRRLNKAGESGEHGASAEIIRVMEYIQNHLDKKLTLDELAAFASMSKSTLNRHFRQTLRQSPAAYVISLRIAKARRLIDEQRFTKAEIAQLCGFYDSSHMDKNLKSK